MPTTSFHPDTIISDPAQVHAWDAATLRLQNLSSIELMQRAVDAFVGRFVVDYPLSSFERVDVLIGPGNNGGDGAGVADALASLGYTVTAYRYGSETGSQDLQEMWRRLLGNGNVDWRLNEAYSIEQTSVIIDGLFGVGTSRPLEGAFAKTVDTVNQAGVAVVSIDVPSGQSIDGRSPRWACVQATHTYTFGAIKYSALLSDTGPAWGTPVILDIGLCRPEEVPELQVPSSPKLLTHESLGTLLAPRPRFTHKGTWGHVLILSGSRGHAGAALLAGTGAYRAGAGLVTFYVPSALEPIMQLGLPEAMTLTDPDAGHLTTLPDLGPYDSIVVGPGLGKRAQTAVMLAQLFASVGERPLVIDADALNLLAADVSLSAKLPANAVLTPHPGEFARLVGQTLNGRARLEALQSYTGGLARSQAVVVLKDQYTVLAKAGHAPAVNFYHGNPGMGTGGMGDVLSGVIGAQLARGLSTWDAARVGVYLHAAAGDLAAEATGERALLAMDLTNYLGQL